MKEHTGDNDPVALPHRQCAASIIRNQTGQVLFVQHNYGQKLWSAPGGVVEVGETPMQAAVREAAEETGLGIEITGVIGVYLLQGGGWPDILSHVFSASITGGYEEIQDTSEIARIEWRSLDHLPGPLTPDVEAALEDVRAERVGVVRTVERKTMLPALI
jgi:8-oxo-dGTP diphosphatase